MKKRVMGEVLQTSVPVDLDVLLAGKALRRKVIAQGEEGGKAIDVVAEDDLDAEQFFRQVKALMTKGTLHIHRCYHREFGEPIDRPCVIEEEVKL